MRFFKDIIEKINNKQHDGKNFCPKNYSDKNCSSDKITISFITASYNYENFIQETIKSVQSQSVQDWEMIIVDDGSKDNSVEVIKSIAKNDSRIKLYQHEGGKNRGLAKTLQLGLSKASGNWIVFLESDDTIEPNYLREKIEVIKKYPEVSLIFNDLNLFGEETAIKNMEDEYINKFHSIIKNFNYPVKFGNEFLHLNIVPTFSVVMLKKSALQNVNWFCAIPSLIDYHLWSQIAYDNEFYYLDKKLTNWRIHKDSYINNKLDERKFAYFRQVQLKSNLNGNKWLLFYHIKFRLLVLKRKIIRWSYKNKELELFGKKFKY